MEEIYCNVEIIKSVHSTTLTKPTGSRRCPGAFVLFLGLLSVLLLAGLIGLGVHYHNSGCGSVANRTEELQASLLIQERDQLKDKLVNTTEERDQLKARLVNTTEERDQLKAKLFNTNQERDQLKASLIQMTEERNRLQNLSKQKKTCPAGWTMFNCVCYFLSSKSGSWQTGREDCRQRGADLVVIDSAEVQKFLSGFTRNPTWIGLSDFENEGTWKWIDGTPLTLTYWASSQPDNGGGDPKYGEEDCAQIRTYTNDLWNDLSCSSHLHWICGKIQ
ncbi:CD209 antigen-like protein E [Anabas testudineus]|uniref:CD209 antigen-like protein E n=1 Tax=Anabas testudineus TaxID=64144 RepID=UPI000E460603|nr:CD209 antigen-like protein E [Anabas testudineus]